ncbi:HAD-IIB family hydrolase [Mesomycoplasma hyorhinis]|uniref:HAD-IIB family hydrolase n=1 Tax=Mesomycoplasma hyorhinis TaxID=2100 RepID=A0ABD6IDR3_MESHY|nr:HAD-IIB family hydrolase [Mesomycoplasma hyorhinis]MXR11304.1 HAD-IIB family hydrolase [Mesomycoplasma hyorhinis]MXR38492.1 HAD-IIB family hydrolase [Mesomycoplasma hyorhinis]MXR43361.1 HAD-IIB family hydrolase [Mesomycoplasma hyorhinis]
MLKKKIFFIDLDGTLLDVGFGISASMSKKNEKAVVEASQKNIIVISTGRKYSKKVEEIAKKTQAKYVACLNGSYILNPINNQILKEEIIQNYLVKDIFKIAQKQKISFSTDNAKHLFGQGLQNQILAFITCFKSFQYQDFKTENAHKILIMSISKKKIVKTFYEIKKKYKGVVSLALVAKGRAIEITNKNATKGEVVKFIANLENFDLENTIHIGDSMNDASTKNIVGTLIALKSGSKNLKKIANKIGPKSKPAGVAKILRKESD